MATLRHLAAIRSRLFSDTTLPGILAKDMSGNPAIYIANIFDIREPLYPCVTLSQMDGSNPPWATTPGGTVYGGQTLLECQVMIQTFSKNEVDEASTIDDYIFALLHKQEGRISSANATFKECRRTWVNSAAWDGSANFWRSASRYLVRVFLH